MDLPGDQEDFIGDLVSLKHGQYYWPTVRIPIEN